MKYRTLLVAAAVACASAGALAHGAGHPPGAPIAKEQQPWGIAGDAAGARTIRVAMSDAMRFTPNHLTVREGETVRFVVRNDGRLAHEMVIGDRRALDEHAALMRRFPQMEHDEPYMTHVKPGARGELVWNFNRPGEFRYACLVPGHYEAGMTGKITVVPAGKPARGKPTPAQANSHQHSQGNIL